MTSSSTSGKVQNVAVAAIVGIPGAIAGATVSVFESLATAFSSTSIAETNAKRDEALAQINSEKEVALADKHIEMEDKKREMEIVKGDATVKLTELNNAHAKEIKKLEQPQVMKIKTKGRVFTIHDSSKVIPNIETDQDVISFDIGANPEAIRRTLEPALPEGFSQYATRGIQYG